MKLSQRHLNSSSLMNCDIFNKKQANHSLLLKGVKYNNRVNITHQILTKWV